MQIDDILAPDSRDINAMLTLNNEHAEETSLLNLQSLKALLDLACFGRGVDRGATAFLIALKQTAAYANPNFLWFQGRRDSFIYVDRIIVSQSARGRGIAKAFYNQLFSAANEAGIHSVLCEVNIDPPNPASEAFHVAMGFTRIGEATIHGGTKTVRYLERLK